MNKFVNKFTVIVATDPHRDMTTLRPYWSSPWHDNTQALEKTDTCLLYGTMS